jgi:glutamate-5-semialdehyde dehydrogenase
MKAIKESTNMREEMLSIGKKAKAAAAIMASSSNAEKNEALLAAAAALREHTEAIIVENNKDVAEAKAKGLEKAMIERLIIDAKKIEGMAKGLEDIAKFDDPVGKELAAWDRPNGLNIARVSVPLGVIGIIYESRPNVTADAGALCLKSGNAAILRGGSESFNSSKIIAECLHAGLAKAGLPTDAIQLIPTRDRAAVGEMLQMTDYIDVIIPRGGKGLCQRVMTESRVPTLLHLEGNCHTYIHERASSEMAVSVVNNAKLRRTGICGATESIVIDKAVAAVILPKIADSLIAGGCEIRGDEAARNIDSRVNAATDEDYYTEYLDAIVSVKVVENLEAAIDFINKYSSHHTEAIITEDAQAAAKFLNKIDSAIVMHNASTQFADGGEFGMGAEIGISTGRLHARGPVGAEQLTTYKYVVKGSGQVRPV